MSSFALRLLAFCSMACDHLGLALFPGAAGFRAAGRLAFPLYCFLLAEGARRTSDRKRYFLRLLALALPCEILFDLLLFGRPFCAIEQNALFSLLLSLACLHAADRLPPRLRLLPLIAGCFAAMALRLSRGWLGPALCFAFFGAGRSRRTLAAAILPALYAGMLALAGVQTSWALLSLCACFAALPIALYSGRRGPYGPLWRAAFYLACPLHLLALLALRASRIVPPWAFR